MTFACAPVSALRQYSISLQRIKGRKSSTIIQHKRVKCTNVVMSKLGTKQRRQTFD